MNDAAPTPLTARRVAEDILRNAILVGELKPGQRLTERSLCELAGVGRTTVREAVRQLESEGLISTVPHRGPVVAVLSEGEARDLYELRAMLEGQAGRLCVLRGDARHAAALHAAVDQMEHARQAGSMLGILEANGAFYAALNAGARNEALRQAMLGVQNRLAFFRFTSTRWPGRAERSVAELRAIAAAVVARDAAAAEAACIRHIEASAELALLVLAERARGAAMVRGGRRNAMERGLIP
ncbi:GntR family transcriptional regulator [Teichococcus coralli]|nr:GntR family transcriptional regulator [Pseudoroseomonas coralli]